jgi:hypothetical protein
MSAGIKAFFAERNETFQKKSEIAASDEIKKNAPATKGDDNQK